MKRTFVYLSLALSTSIAGAQTSTSTKLELPKETSAAAGIHTEYYFQAPKGQTAASTSIEYNSQAGELRGTTGSIRESGSTYNLNVEHGFTDSLSAGLKVGYMDGATQLGSTTFDKQGFTDIRLALKGQYQINENSEALYGLYAFHSLEDKHQKIKLAIPSMDKIPVATQPQSGGSSLNLYAGYQRLMGTTVVGARVLQSVAGTRRTTRVRIEERPTFLPPGALPAGDIKVVEKGGGCTDVAIFAERPVANNFTLGSAFSYRRRARIEQTIPERRTYSTALQVLALEVNPTMYVEALNIDVVGQVKYSKLLETHSIYEGKRIGSGDIVDVSVGARYLF